VLGARGTANVSTHSNAWIATAIVGGVAVLLGACAVAPAYVSVLEPLAVRVRGSGLVAVRSLARQRTRTAAVVSAIAATSALAIAATSLVLSSHIQKERAARFVRPDEVQLTGFGPNGLDQAPDAKAVAKVRAILPDGTTELRTQMPARTGVVWSLDTLTFDHPADRGSDQEVGGSVTQVQTVLASPAVVDEYRVRGDDRAQLTRTGALYINDGYLGRGNGTAIISLDVHKGAAPGTRRRKFSVPMVDGDHYLLGTMPRLLVTPALAARLGMHAAAGPVVLRAPHSLSAKARHGLATIYDAAPGVSVVFHSPPGGIDPGLAQWVLVAAALLMVLFVVAANLALSAETCDERDVLSIVGAAPAVMRRANGYKAAVQTVMGSLLAIPVGFLPIVVFVSAEHSHRPLVFPWTIVALLVVGLPVVGGLVTTTASGIALRVRPVRVSTMAYD
jgi:hypothetical protein